MIAIKIENLSKQYRLGMVSTRTLSHDLNRWYQTTIRGKDDPYMKIGETAGKNLTAKTQRREENNSSLRLSASAVKDSQRLCASAVKNKTAIAALHSPICNLHPKMTGRENISLKKFDWVRS